MKTERILTVLGGMLAVTITILVATGLGASSLLALLLCVPIFIIFASRLNYLEQVIAENEAVKDVVCSKKYLIQELHNEDTDQTILSLVIRVDNEITKVAEIAFDSKLEASFQNNRKKMLQFFAQHVGAIVAQE